MRRSPIKREQREMKRQALLTRTTAGAGGPMSGPAGGQAVGSVDPNTGVWQGYGLTDFTLLGEPFLVYEGPPEG